ncbi:MAG: FAD/NAD(P)-binding oxidoreductase [Alphaproteobacteria bacterium]
MDTKSCSDESGGFGVAGPPVGRRAVLAGAGAAALALALPWAGRAAGVATKARILVAGGGAAGLAAASRLAARLDGADIVLLEPRAEHVYQPGLTLVGAGIKRDAYVRLSTADYVPRGVAWLRESVVAFEPEANRLATDGGQTLTYDFLVVATGLALDYGAVAGMEPGLIGHEGIASVYAGADAARASFAALGRFVESGGVGLFGRPATDMKCAGAPLKQTFLADDLLRRAGRRDRAELTYMAHNDTVFAVPAVDARVRDLFARQAIAVRSDHVLTAIDPARRIATYATPAGPVEMGWDFINLIPPMTAPPAVRDSALAWPTGPFAAGGWLEVDPFTLRHRRFANVFGIGDVCGIPKGKTAASVKWQAPVAVDHLVAAIAGGTSAARYDGYTSCLLITRIGQAMLVEFDYDNRLVPSFPFIRPLDEGWLPWVIKVRALKANYTAMLRGLA